MSEALLFGIGGVVLLFAVAAIAVYGVHYSKTLRMEQIGERFPTTGDQRSKPGTPV